MICSKKKVFSGVAPSRAVLMPGVNQVFELLCGASVETEVVLQK